jgi:hypothetical protein
VIVSTEKSNLDDCRYCNLPFEIEAVSFEIFKPCRALLVCRNCGLAHAEDDGQRSHIRDRIATFGSRLARFCGRLATKLLFLFRNRAFRFTPTATWF